MGGSATSEGGLSLLPAFGVSVKCGNPSLEKKIIFGRDLADFVSFDLPGNQKLYPGIKFEIAADVNNPYTGPSGAVNVFAKQKGANEDIRKELESNMIKLQNYINKKLNIDLGTIKSTGAAGGISGMLLAVLEHVELKKGSEIVADAIKVREY